MLRRMKLLTMKEEEPRANCSRRYIERKPGGWTVEASGDHPHAVVTASPLAVN